VHELSVISIAVIGNTTCPVSDIYQADLHFSDIDVLLQAFGAATFAFQMCPPILFAQIIKINNLRVQAWESTWLEPRDLSHSAHDILRSIYDFSPEQWENSKPSSRADWISLGSTYQAAITLYCVYSLQSLSILPQSPSLRDCCDRNGQMLWSCLSETLASPKTRRFALWPLVLLGVDAINIDTTRRVFIQTNLLEMSRHLGTRVPLIAKGVLERFWTSGKTKWDECFDQPFAFATQIAVDLSGLLH